MKAKLKMGKLVGTVSFSSCGKYERSVLNIEPFEKRKIYGCVEELPYSHTTSEVSATGAGRLRECVNTEFI